MPDRSRVTAYPEHAAFLSVRQRLIVGCFRYSCGAGYCRDNVFDRLTGFLEEGSRGGIALFAAASVGHVHSHHGRAAGVEVVNGVVLAVEICVQRPGRRGPALQAVPLAEASLSWLILAGAEVQHARGGVVVFTVVAKAGDLLRQDFTVRRIGQGLDSLRLLFP